MGKVEIIVLIFAAVILVFRIYQKYIKKDKGKRGTDSEKPTGSMPGSSVEDDDYEPYAKK